MWRISILFILTLPLALSLNAQENSDDEKNSEGFKTASVSDFMTGKYQWKTSEEEKEIEVDTSTPIKSREQKLADYRARQDAYWAALEEKRKTAEKLQDEGDDEEGLDTFELDEFNISEEFSPLMRMSAMKDLDELNPESGAGYLAERYYNEFESQYLNRWTIPLIGKSQEQLAKDRYEQEQYERFLDDISESIETLKNLDSDLADEFKDNLNDVQYQRTNEREREAVPGRRT